MSFLFLFLLQILIIQLQYKTDHEQYYNTEDAVRALLSVKERKMDSDAGDSTEPSLPITSRFTL